MYLTYSNHLQPMGLPQYLARVLNFIMLYPRHPQLQRKCTLQQSWRAILKANARRVLWQEKSWKVCQRVSKALILSLQPNLLPQMSYYVSLGNIVMIQGRINAICTETPLISALVDARAVIIWQAWNHVFISERYCAPLYDNTRKIGENR